MRHTLSLDFSFEPYFDHRFFCIFRMTRYTTYLIVIYFIPLTLASNHAIIKDIGNIGFFEKMWTNTFDLNLQAYIENAILLQNVTEKLARVCKHIPDDIKCDYFKKKCRKKCN